MSANKNKELSKDFYRKISFFPILFKNIFSSKKKINKINLTKSTIENNNF